MLTNCFCWSSSTRTVGSAGSAPGYRALLLLFHLGCAVTMLGCTKVDLGNAVDFEQEAPEIDRVFLDRPKPKVEVQVDTEVMERAKAKLWPKHGAALSWVLHGVRTFPADTKPPMDYPTLDELGAVFVNDGVCREWYSGQHCLTKSRSGLRYVTASTGNAVQAHTDQVLATMAELDLPLGHAIETPLGEFSVREVLEDAKANFSPESELEWTSIAFAYYLPPQTSWKTRFEEEFSFDDLVRFLIRRPIDRTSCGGTHALYALATIVGVDGQYQILSGEARSLATDFLKMSVRHAAQSQKTDGSFSPLWYSEMVASQEYQSLLPRGKQFDLLVNRVHRTKSWSSILSETSDQTALLLVTGHHLEWMMLLPQELQPAPEVFRTGAQYLAGRLKDMPDQLTIAEVCPYSHAYLVVQRLGSTL